MKKSNGKINAAGKGAEGKNKEGMTELVFILDKSGSMSGLESDTIGGFNAMIEKQRKDPGECLVSTVLFSSESEVLHDRVPLEKIAPLTEKEYSVGGCTALLDAVGNAIRHIGNVHKYARKEDVPSHTVFVITTDGMENASREFTPEKVKKMVTDRKEKNGWEFVFLGANIDAVETAGRIGISKDRACDYRADGQGTAVLYEAVSDLVGDIRANLAFSPEWKKPIEEDNKSR